MTHKRVLLLPGEGIGPEVIGQVRRVIDWLAAHVRLCEHEQVGAVHRRTLRLLAPKIPI